MFGGGGFFSVTVWEPGEDDLNNRIKSVIREHHFSPPEIDAFFLDGVDYWGLDWWYADVKECVDEIKKK